MLESSSASFAAETQKKLARNWLKELSILSDKKIPAAFYGAARLHCDLKQLLDIEARECPRNESPILLHEFLKRASPLYARLFELADLLGIEMESRFVSRMRFIEEYDPYRKAVLAPVVREEIEWLLNEPLQPGVVETLADLLRHNFPVYHEVAHAILSQLVSFSIPKPDKRASDEYFLFVECLVGVQEAMVAEQLGGFIGDPLNKANSTYRMVSDGSLARVAAPSQKELMSCLMTHLASIHDWPVSRQKRELPAWAPFDPRKTVGYHADFFVKELQPRWLKKNVYREALPKKAGKIRRLELERFDFEHLRSNRELMERICQWLRKLFEYDAYA